VIKKLAGSQLKFISFSSEIFKPNTNLCIDCFSQGIYCPSKHFFIYGLAAVLAITKHKTEYLNNCYTFIKLRPVNRTSCAKPWCTVSIRPMSYLIGPRPNVPSVAKFIWSKKYQTRRTGNLSVGMEIKRCCCFQHLPFLMRLSNSRIKEVLYFSLHQDLCQHSQFI